MLRGWVVPAAMLALVSCKSDERCSETRLLLRLTFFGPERVKSILVTYRGDGLFEREIHEVTGAPNVEIVARSVPLAEIVMSVRAYDREDARGKLLAEGSVGPLVIDRCRRLELELTDRFLLNPDASVPPDAGSPDAAPDAGEDPEDAGVDDGGEPPTNCPTVPDDATLALFPFDSGEAGGGVVTDVISGRTGTARGDVASTAGAEGCGDAAAFAGNGYLEIPSEGLAPALGSVDFFVRFEGQPPSTRQGVVTRDANGQTVPGHLAFFRSCDDHLVVRMQNTVETVSLCSDLPLPAGAWVHVALDFGEPGLSFLVDGAPVTPGAHLVGLDCGAAHRCDGAGVFELSGNQNPWVLGADSSTSEEGSAEPSGNYFVGAIDELRVSQVRRSP